MTTIQDQILSGLDQMGRASINPKVENDIFSGLDRMAIASEADFDDIFIGPPEPPVEMLPMDMGMINNNFLNGISQPEMSDPSSVSPGDGNIGIELPPEMQLEHLLKGLETEPFGSRGQIPVEVPPERTPVNGIDKPFAWGLATDPEQGRVLTDKELSFLREQRNQGNLDKKQMAALMRAEYAADPLLGWARAAKQMITGGATRPFAWGEKLLPGLKEELEQNIKEEFPSQMGTVAGAGEQVVDNAIQFYLIFPKLFKAFGLAGNLLGRVPGASKAIKAGKTVIGLEKLSKVAPRIEKGVSSTIEAAAKGWGVGGTDAAITAYNKGMSLEDAAPMIIQEANAMAAVASAFNVVGQIDTAVYVSRLRKQLVESINKKWAAKYNSYPQHPTYKNQRVVSKEALAGMQNMKQAELQTVDRIVSAIESNLYNLKTKDIYNRGQEKIENPWEAAQRIVKDGLQAGQSYPKGDPRFKTGLGKSEPYIKQPKTRVGEIIEDVKYNRQTAKENKRIARAEEIRNKTTEVLQKPNIKQPKTRAGEIIEDVKYNRQTAKENKRIARAEEIRNKTTEVLQKPKTEAQTNEKPVAKTKTPVADKSIKTGKPARNKVDSPKAGISKPESPQPDDKKTEGQLPPIGQTETKTEKPTVPAPDVPEKITAQKPAETAPSEEPLGHGPATEGEKAGKNELQKPQPKDQIDIFDKTDEKGYTSVEDKEPVNEPESHSKSLGRTREPGISSVSSEGDSQRGGVTKPDQRKTSPVGGRDKPADKDVLVDEPTTGNSLSGDRVSPETVGVERQPTVDDTSKSVSQSGSHAVVPKAPKHDDTAESPHVDKNFSVQEAESVLLSKGERKKTNKTVKELLDRGGPFTDEDKDTIRQYTGEGGLTSGSQEALNQHYTDYDTIRSIYQALDDAGVPYKTALEPSVGAGSFVGMRPDIDWTTVDIDETNHKVVSALYPKGKHYNVSYEDFTRKGYDLVVSNVPFLEVRGEGRLKARRDIKALHDFYFVHSLDRVKDNGVIAFITSKGSMDKLDGKIRQEVVDSADVIGAYRLPQAHFRANAHTDVTTDVIFLQKRPAGVKASGMQAKYNQWFVKSSKTEDNLPLNEYYQNLLENILGTLEVGKNKLYGGAPAYAVTGEANLSRIKIDYHPYEAIKPEETEPVEEGEIPTNMMDFGGWIVRQPNIKHRLGNDVLYGENIIVDDGVVYTRTQEVQFEDVAQSAKIYEPLTGDLADKILLLDYINKSALKYQATKEDVYADDGVKGIIDYAQKFKRKAPHKDTKLKKLFKDLEEKSLYFEYTSLFDDQFEPANVFYVQTKHEDSGKMEATGESSLKERAFASENQKGIIIISQTDLIERVELIDLLNNGYALIDVTNADATVQNNILYYSGNIYKKLEETEDLYNSLGEEHSEREFLQTQIAKLNDVKPAPKTLDEIYFKGNETWLYPIMDKYFRGVIWSDTDKNGNTVWHTSQTSGGNIYEKFLNNRALISRLSNDSGWQEPMSAYMNRLREAEMELADLLEAIKRNISRKPEMLAEVEYAYNSRFRNYVKPDYLSAQYLIQDVLDEISHQSAITLRKNQIEWVIQAIYEGKGINAHDVGGGKTMAAITLARVLKKRGIAKKPVFVVPAKTIHKWVRETQWLFPNATIVNLGSLPADKRNKALFELANTNADYVFISPEGFTKIKLPFDAELQYFNELADEQIDDPKATGRQAALIQEKISEYRAVLRKEKRDTRLTFDKLGFDMIVADEAHNYKNIGIRGSLVKYGLGTPFNINIKYAGDRENTVVTSATLSSARSYDFRFKANYVAENNNSNNVFLLTATPTDNKPMEIYTMLRHLGSNILLEYGIPNDIEFAKMFFETGSVQDPNRDKPKNILKAIINAQDLRGILNRFVDKIAIEDMDWIKIPTTNEEEHFVDQSEEYAIIAEDLRIRENTLPSPPLLGDDRLVNLYTEGRSASVDPRLYGATEHATVSVDNRSFDVADDKIEWVIDKLVDVFESDSSNGQLVFSDISGHTQVEKGKLDESLHSEIKSELVKRGFKPKQVAIINGKVVTNPETGKEVASGDKNKRKQSIADAYNAGKIKVVIGSTTSMGEGMDLQVKTTDIYHLDIPYKPGAYRQRNGRAIRYGNENDVVNVHYLFMRGSFDHVSHTIVIQKKGWNEALWEKDVADRISTEEEMTMGAIPRGEQILIELETDPTRKELLRLRLLYNQILETNNNNANLLKGLKNQISKIQSQIAQDQKFLEERTEKLSTITPNEKIKNKQKRRETFEKKKENLRKLIETSNRRAQEGIEALERKQRQLKDATKDQQDLAKKLAEFENRHLTEAGEIIIGEPIKEKKSRIPRKIKKKAKYRQPARSPVLHRRRNRKLRQSGKAIIPVTQDINELFSIPYKIAKTLASSPATIQSVDQLAKSAPKWGKVLGDTFFKITDREKELAGHWLYDLQESLGHLTRKEQENFRKAIRGNAEPMNDTVQTAIDDVLDLTEAMGVLKEGVGLKTYTPEGETPFLLKEDMYPLYWSKDTMDAVQRESGEIYDDLVEWIAEDMEERGIEYVNEEIRNKTKNWSHDSYVKQAQRFLRHKRRFDPAGKELTSLWHTLQSGESPSPKMQAPRRGWQYHRAFEYPDEFLDTNPNRVMENFIHSSARRIAEAEIWGPKSERLKKIIAAGASESSQRAKLKKKDAEGASLSFLQTAAHLIGYESNVEGLQSDATRGAKKWLRRARVATGATHLFSGFASGRNIIFGMGSMGTHFGTLKTIYHFMGTLLNHVRIRDAREAGALEHSGVKHFFAEGFAPELVRIARAPMAAAEILLRTSAAQCGVATWTRAIKKAHKKGKEPQWLIRELTNRDVGFTVKQVKAMIKRGMPDSRESKKMMRGAVNITQFSADAKDIPKSWGTEIGRFVTQFWSMAYKHTQNTIGYMLLEMGYGRFKPLFRFIIAVMFAGLGHSMLRSLFRGEDISLDDLKKLDVWLRATGESLGIIEKPLHMITATYKGQVIRNITPASLGTAAELYYNAQASIKHLITGDKAAANRDAVRIVKTTGLGRDVLGVTGNYDLSRKNRKVSGSGTGYYARKLKNRRSRRNRRRR